MEAFATSLKEKDKRITFMMSNIIILTGNRPTNSKQKHDPSLQKGVENSTKVAKNAQPKADEAVRTNQLKELIKEVVHNQVKSII